MKSTWKRSKALALKNIFSIASRASGNYKVTIINLVESKIAFDSYPQ